MNFGGRAGGAGDFAQEGAFSLVAFKTMDARAGDIGELNGDDQAGEPGAGSHVDPAPGVGREGEKLGAVGDVAGPDRSEARRGDEIGDLSPPVEKVDVERESGLGLGWEGNQGEGFEPIGAHRGAVSRETGAMPPIRRFAPPLAGTGRARTAGAIRRPLGGLRPVGGRGRR